MTSYATTTASDVRLDAYDQAERALWQHYGLVPHERIVPTASTGGRMRVLENGSGDPVLFVHGTVGPGAWASLIHELPEFRSIVVERPGWGLSSPVDFSRRDYGATAGDLLRDLLDGLGLERAHVVGGSIGNVWALRLAARHASRVGRVVLTGGSPIVSEAGIPRMIKMIASPLGALMIRISGKPRTTRKILRASGHAASLDDGRIPDAFVEWRAAVDRETDAMRHERAMVRAIVEKDGYTPDLTFTEDELRAIEVPVLHLFGTGDSIGSLELWRKISRLLPRGELLALRDAGHMPWFDDVGTVAASIREFFEDAS